MLVCSPNFGFLGSSFAVLPALFSSSSHQLPSHRLYFFAGIINDLTDTLNERCSESVKQVVIKADAASPFAVVRREGEESKKGWKRRENSIERRAD